MTQHEQVTIAHPAHGPIEVDAGVAGFLRLLWRLGVDTRCSCQDAEHRPGMVMVGIDDVHQLQHLLSEVHAAGDADMQLVDDWFMDGWTDGSPRLLMDVFIPQEQIEDLALLLEQRLA